MAFIAAFAVLSLFGYGALAATTISTNISTDGTLSVTGASTLTGNVTAAGTLAVTGASTLTGNVTAEGTLTVDGASTLTGAVTATAGLTSGANILSDTDSTDSLGVTGTRWASTFSDNFTGNTITLDGATGVNVLTVTDNVADALSIIDSSGDLMVFDTRTGAEVLTITPNTTIAGNLTVSGTFSPDIASTTRFSVQDISYFGGTGTGGATTTIDALGNLTVVGTADVTGKTTLANASTTSDVSVVGNIWVNGNATTTSAGSILSQVNIAAGGGYSPGGSGVVLTAIGGISANGNLIIDGTSTLTGLTSMIQASSTRLSVQDVSYFGGTGTGGATTTIDALGNLTVVGTLDVTGTSTFVDAVELSADLALATASSTGLVKMRQAKVGGAPNDSTMSSIVFGYCNLPSTTVTASTTVAAQCTGATGLDTNHRVFVQATSSLASRFIIQSASSTAADTIGVMIYNNDWDGGATEAGEISLNFWAVR
ncbi:MAG: hypothetical protein COV10_01210 [Candidatus Vogelbacteria bacterium CG10_big_fil_rev_8_21_14_0_10_51_16]|uniref:Uncharacterized protein n=1 Tax=Candidatus Vogelbacteria bacterium CG10_big_fil_rev_8_21_14_0_10_51_16 TaxID=1975045 RepID=A0A2H0RFH7_9BACT|nr:MAG: hypothetical protein COV10_01210 [Candidatus Vogelbacteria bacterium CG10_big_fil_rev_8_21_14_0_10_51_16]